MRGVEGLGPILSKLRDLLLAFRVQRCLQVSITLQQFTNRVNVADLAQKLLHLLQRGQPLLQLRTVQRPEHLERIAEAFRPHAEAMQFGMRLYGLSPPRARLRSTPWRAWEGSQPHWPPPNRAGSTSLKPPLQQSAPMRRARAGGEALHGHLRTWRRARSCSWRKRTLISPLSRVESAKCSSAISRLRTSELSSISFFRAFLASPAFPFGHRSGNKINAWLKRRMLTRRPCTAASSWLRAA